MSTPLRSRSFTPAYVALWQSGELASRVERALGQLGSCTLCPHACHVNRMADTLGTCRTGRYARVSSCFAHSGEEDCLRGTRGSGTIFFSGCNLHCVFCQNFEISSLDEGDPVSPHELAKMMLKLQALGCHNINLVTPDHSVPQILEALLPAVEGGLRLPLVYNSNAYNSSESLQLLDGVVDIYMPDFKFWSVEMSRRYLHASDYPEIARAAIKQMHRQVGMLALDENGLALRGLMIRHLVMPGAVEETREIARWIAAELSPDTYVNIMPQYHAAGKVSANEYAEISRSITDVEFRQAINAAYEAGLRRLDARSASRF